MHLFDQLANKLTDKEDSFFSDQPYSEKYFKLELLGNKRTGNQIKEWRSKGVIELEETLANWDHSTLLEIPMEDGGEIQKFHLALEGNNIPDNLPDLGQMLLYNSSKLTDFINGSFLDQYGFIVNNETIDIIKKLNTEKHNSYPIELIHKSDLIKSFSFFKFSASADNYIDYERSKFYTQKGILNYESRKDIEIINEKDFKDKQEKLRVEQTLIYAKEIHLKNEFPNYDMFNISTLGVRGVFVSKNFLKSLNTNTGISVNKTKRIK